MNLLKSRQLDEPDDVVRVDVVLHGPLGQDVPLVLCPPIYGQAELGVLVLAVLQVVDDLLQDLGKELAADVVVRLEKHFAQLALPDRVVLGVELVEAVEKVTVLRGEETKFVNSLESQCSR